VGLLTEALVDGAVAEEIERLPLPEDYLAAHLRAEDAGMFSGVADKDVRKSLRVGRVPLPELAPDEVLVAVMASAINYNTVWSAMLCRSKSHRCTSRGVSVLVDESAEESGP
jgi:crotonyl-CoA reductase